MNTSDTISAISTPYGRGGIAVIRISGEGAVEAADRFFKPFSGKSLFDIPSGSTAYGRILYNNEQIDDGIASVFRAPHSFTGEDTVEISCHGGIVLSQTVLESSFLCGSRPAEAGEFTKRAFLNGKISLSQAEAVMGLIDAGSREAIRLCSAQSQGVLSKKIDAVASKISEMTASVYAYIDYPDEDLTDLSPNELIHGIDSLINELSSLLSTYKTARAVTEGIMTVIVGKPNTGKSSLLNRIIGRQRAIVTDVAGTTRDTVEETVNIGRVTLRLCDTAGIHETDDLIESIGVDRSKEMIEAAELILAVFDSSRPLDGDDIGLIDSLITSGKQVIPVINKNDINGAYDLLRLDALGEPILLSSATGEGFDTLYSRISELFVSEKIDYNTTAVIANARQNACASAALQMLISARDALSSGLTQDMAGLDLESALSLLRELDGRAAAAEITDTIFGKFCVGK